MTTVWVLLQDILGRSRGVAATAVAFAVIAASLPAIALATEVDVLASAAAPLLWLATVLAALLSLEALWHRPAQDGRFDVLLLSGVSPMALAVAVLLAHWILTGLPLVASMLLLAPMLQMPASVFSVLLPSMALGTLYLTLVGGAGAVLVLGARGAGILMAVLVLPLMLPMLLLGQMAILRGNLVPDDTNPYLLLQAALVIVAVPAFAGLVAHLLRSHFSR